MENKIDFELISEGYFETKHFRLDFGNEFLIAKFKIDGVTYLRIGKDYIEKIN